MVLEVVNDVVFIKVVQYEFDDVTQYELDDVSQYECDDVILAMVEVVPLPYVKIVVEDDLFFHHLVFSLFQQIRRRKWLMLQDSPILQIKQ